MPGWLALHINKWFVNMKTNLVSRLFLIFAVLVATFAVIDGTATADVPPPCQICDVTGDCESVGESCIHGTDYCIEAQ